MTDIPASFEVTPIGVVHSPHAEPVGTPIQPSKCRGVEGEVEVYPPYVEGLGDLDGFDRVWLIYWFHRVGPTRLSVTPFMDAEPRGVFATRAPCRPNAIGMSSVRVLGVDGGRIRIADVDVVDGTPLLDIKPYVPEFDSYPDVRVGWLAHATDRSVADERFTGGRKE